MAAGQTTLARAMVAIDRSHTYAAGKSTHRFFAEDLATLKGTELEKVLAEIDEQTKVKLDSRWHQEHTDAFALLRDHRYQSRSRQWLWRKAAQSKINAAHASISRFSVEHGQFRDNLLKLIRTPVSDMVNKTATDTMKEAVKP